MKEKEHMVKKRALTPGVPAGDSLPPEVKSQLERVSETVLVSTRDAGERMQGYYVRLAEEALDTEGQDGQLEQEVERELGSLRRTSENLGQALQTAMEMEDELSARLRDMRKSRDRKWYLPNPPANASIDLTEERTKHFAQGINLYKLLLVCIVGSFAGVMVELLWCFATRGYIESRSGLVYGPFNLLYGAGAVALTLALYRYRNRGRWISFLGGMVVGSAVEYFCSWAQETLIGSRSWDYSGVPLNINGRICLLYSVFWGLLGILWIKDIYPRMAKWILKLPNRAGKVITWALTVFMIFNAIVSCITVWRWSQRVEGVEADGSFWAFIDERFPDERMERIFANMEFQ